MSDREDEVPGRAPAQDGETRAEGADGSPSRVRGGAHPVGSAAGLGASLLRGRHASAKEIEALLQVQRQRAVRAEARRRELEERLQAALEEAEEHRIVAVELRTILDATSYRISTLEQEADVRERETTALREGHEADLALLAQEAEDARRRLTETERERDAAERGANEIRAELDEQRRCAVLEVGALRGELEQRTAQCLNVDEELRRARQAEAELQRSARELVALRVRDEADAGEQRARSAALETEIEDLRGRQARSEERCSTLAGEVEAVRAALDEARSAGLALREEIDRRQEEVDELVRALDAAGAAERSLQDRLGGVNDELSRAREDLAHSQSALSVEQWAHASNVESLRAMVADQARQIEALGGRLFEVGETSATLEGRLGDLLQEMARRAQDRERLTAALATVQEERDRWLHDWQEAAGRTAQLEREGETSRAQAREAIERAEGAEERLLCLQAEIAALRGELAASHERLRGGEEWTAALESEIASLEQESALLKRLREEDAAELRRKEAALENALDAGAQLWSELVGSLRARDEARADARRREEEVRSLRERLERETAELAARAAAGSELEERMRLLEQERAAAAEEAAARRGELEQRDAALEMARAELAATERAHGEAVAALESGERRRLETEGELEAARAARNQTLEEARRQAGEAERHRAELEERLAVAAAELERTRSELGQRTEESEGRRAELEEQLAVAAAELERSRAELGQRTEESERRRADLEAQLAVAAGELERSRAELGYRAEESEQRRLELEEQLAAAGRELERTRADLDARAVELEQRRAELAEKLAVAQGELEQARGEVQRRAEGSELERVELEERLGSVARELERTRSELGQRLEESERRRSELEERLAALGEEVERSRDELGRKSEDAERRRVDLDERLAAAAAELERTRLALTERTEESERRQAELGAQVAVAERELARAREELARQANDRLEQVGSLEADRELWQARAEQVDRDRADIEERLAAVERLRQELAQQVTALRAQLEGRERDVAELRSSVDEARADRERWRDGEARLADERDAAAQRSLAAETRSQALEAEIEELRRSIADWIPPERHGEMEAQIEELRGALTEARERESRLQEAADELQQQLLREQAHSAGLWNDLESQNRFREALDSALSDARSRYGEIESALQREQRRWSEEQTKQRNSAEEAAGALARSQLLEVRVSELEAEHEALREDAERLQASRDELDRECEQLRRSSQGDDRERRAEALRLQSRVEELERQQREAAQRHSGAVSSYMLELNQRTETLRQRDAEAHRLAEELSVMQGTCDDAIAQLAEVKAERDSLVERLRELESARPGPGAHARPGAPSVRADAAHSAQRHGLEKAAPTELRLADEPAPAEEKKPTLQAPPEEKKAASPAVQRPKTPRADGETLWLIHGDEDPSLQEAVRSVVGNFPPARYAALAELGEEKRDGRSLLALNMLSRTIDPIEALTSCAKLGIDDPAAITYFAYGGRGFVAGLVDFFPHPFEPDGCASRLLGRSGGLQRLLAVSEDVDVMCGIREVLGRVRCSTATAFDGRQAMDLVPMIKPEVVLVDLSLPRGEALRVVSRICTDPKTSSIAIALFWTQPLTQKDVAQAALRVVRDYPLTAEDLGHQLSRILSDEELGLVGGEAIRASA